MSYRSLSSTDREISSCCNSEVEIKRHHIVDVNTDLCLVDTQFTPSLGSAVLKLCCGFTLKCKYKTSSRTAFSCNVKPNLCNNQTEDESRTVHVTVLLLLGVVGQICFSLCWNRSFHKLQIVILHSVLPVNRRL